MITAKMKWKTYDKLARQAVKQASIEPLMKCALAVEREAKTSMKQGGRYTGPRGGKQRIPSDAPNPPHVQTGNLRNSISSAKTDQGTAVVGPASSISDYGYIHEYGGEYGGRNYPARPFMRPALDRAQDKFAKLFKRLRLAKTVAGKQVNAKKERR